MRHEAQEGSLGAEMRRQTLRDGKGIDLVITGLSRSSHDLVKGYNS